MGVSSRLARDVCSRAPMPRRPYAGRSSLRIEPDAQYRLTETPQNNQKKDPVACHGGRGAKFPGGAAQASGREIRAVDTVADAGIGQGVCHLPSRLGRAAGR